MDKVRISARIDASLKTALEWYCASTDVVMDLVIQDALLDRLEELEDLEDLKQTRHDSTRPLAALLEELRINGAL